MAIIRWSRILMVGAGLVAVGCSAPLVRCYGKARGVNGHGLWRFTVKQQADDRLGAFIAALRRPSVHTPAGEACPAIGHSCHSVVL